jgi:SMODS-associated and fused to various effectors sensor domain
MREQINRKSPSPVVTARKVPPLTRLLLFVRAGGRCEFDGCNQFLLEDFLTLTEDIFAEMAHIVAFRPGGPRGRSGARPPQINSATNLMLLCSKHHKLIDKRWRDWSRATLESYKAEHERRIRHLTELGPDRKTAVLILRAPIGGQTVAVPFDHLVEATAPLYPSRREPTIIDLTGIDDTSPSFLRTAADTIARDVRRFFEQGGEGHNASHVSVFALAPMPLLIALGRQLTSKVPADVYQRHRHPENWTWKKGGRPVNYLMKRRKTGSGGVGLLIYLSGRIPISALPSEVRRKTLYEITVRGVAPNPTFLRTRQDLDRFRIIYQQALGMIIQRHGLQATIDLFPAVPAPVAVLCGRELLPKVHPKLRVYDYEKTKGGFRFALEV